MSSLHKKSWRQELRERRRQLSSTQQREASLGLDRQLRQQPAVRSARSLAFYIANDGEISPKTTLLRLARQHRHCFLPCLNKRSLVFRRYRPGQTLRKNRFSIPEPPQYRSAERNAARLDIIFLPLVGFDAQGNRLGMGGGFYDRTLSRLPTQPARGPLLIGLAHECQRVNQLPVQSWDIPLDAIATDRGFYWFKRGVR